jgi:hypothetical protein
MNGRFFSLRIRGIERLRFHADLTILAKLATALSREPSWF